MSGTRLNKAVRRRPNWGVFRVGILAGGLSMIAGPVSCSKGITGKRVDAAELKKPAAVRVARVEMKQVRREVESVGSLFPYEEVTVSSEVEGKVEEVMVDIGDRVRQGQVLAVISLQGNRRRRLDAVRIHASHLGANCRESKLVDAQAFSPSALRLGLGRQWLRPGDRDNSRDPKYHAVSVSTRAQRWFQGSTL